MAGGLGAFVTLLSALQNLDWLAPLVAALAGGWAAHLSWNHAKAWPAFKYGAGQGVRAGLISAVPLAVVYPVHLLQLGGMPPSLGTALAAFFMMFFAYMAPLIVGSAAAGAGAGGLAAGFRSTQVGCWGPGVLAAGLAVAGAAAFLSIKPALLKVTEIGPCARLFEDRNRNGVQDAGEPTLRIPWDAEVAASDARLRLRPWEFTPPYQAQPPARFPLSECFLPIYSSGKVHLTFSLPRTLTATTLLEHEPHFRGSYSGSGQIDTFPIGVQKTSVWYVIDTLIGVGLVGALLLLVGLWASRRKSAPPAPPAVPPSPASLGSGVSAQMD